MHKRIQNHVNSRNKMKVVFLTTKKLYISAHSDSCFLSALACKLVLLSPLTTRRFSGLLKPFFIFRAGHQIVGFALWYHLPAVPALVGDFYKFLPSTNKLAYWESFLISAKIWHAALTLDFYESSWTFCTLLNYKGHQRIFDRTVIPKALFIK